MPTHLTQETATECSPPPPPTVRSFPPDSCLVESRKWGSLEGLMLTAWQAKYFAYELTKRCPSDSLQKLSASLADAQVYLNPHQIDAALFAFRSPLPKGTILADEVGLGKTIEAGIFAISKMGRAEAQAACDRTCQSPQTMAPRTRR